MASAVTFYGSRRLRIADKNKAPQILPLQNRIEGARRLSRRQRSKGGVAAVGCTMSCQVPCRLKGRGLGGSRKHLGRVVASSVLGLVSVLVRMILESRRSSRTQDSKDKARGVPGAGACLIKKSSILVKYIVFFWRVRSDDDGRQISRGNNNVNRRANQSAIKQERTPDSSKGRIQGRYDTWPPLVAPSRPFARKDL